MFQIKDFTSITASMVNHARAVTKKITDWVPGSVARTLVEAPAVEIEELYLQMFNGLREAIPVATFQSFNFAKLPAKYAQGYVTVSTETPISEEITATAGTEFRTEDGRVYLSTADVVFAVGETQLTVPVQAEQTGSRYNVSAGAINQSLLFGEGFTVSNSAINNGTDEETSEEQEARFAEYVSALSRGTIEACLYGARQATVTDEAGDIIEYVTRRGYIETPGYVKIYIYSSAGLPSAQLLANGQLLIDGWREPDTQKRVSGYRSGGVRVDILPMVERLIPLTAQVKMQRGYQLTEAVIQNIINAYTTTLTNTNPGTVLYLGTLEADLTSVVGVESVVLDMDSNIVCDPFEVLKPGDINITELVA